MFFVWSRFLLLSVLFSDIADFLRPGCLVFGSQHWGAYASVHGHMQGWVQECVATSCIGDPPGVLPLLIFQIFKCNILHSYARLLRKFTHSRVQFAVHEMWCGPCVEVGEQDFSLRICMTYFKGSRPQDTAVQLRVVPLEVSWKFCC